jgi:hypothetical protein
MPAVPAPAAPTPPIPVLTHLHFLQLYLPSCACHHDGCRSLTPHTPCSILSGCHGCRLPSHSTGTVALLAILLHPVIAADHQLCCRLKIEDLPLSSVPLMRRAHTCFTDWPLLDIVAQIPAIPVPLVITVQIHAPLFCDCFRIPAQSKVETLICSREN